MKRLAIAAVAVGLVGAACTTTSGVVRKTPAPVRAEHMPACPMLVPNVHVEIAHVEKGIELTFTTQDAQRRAEVLARARAAVGHSAEVEHPPGAPHDAETCPMAVADARVEVQTDGDAVRVTVTSDDPAAVAAIQQRADAYAARFVQPDRIKKKRADRLVDPYRL